TRLTTRICNIHVISHYYCLTGWLVLKSTQCTAASTVSVEGVSRTPALAERFWVLVGDGQRSSCCASKNVTTCSSHSLSSASKVSSRCSLLICSWYSSTIASGLPAICNSALKQP